MRWTSTVSEEPVIEPAVRAAATALRAQLADVRPDLLIVFASAHHAEAFDRIPSLIAAAFGSAPILGCSAGGVIGGGHEVEQRPGVSLTAAVLPGVDVVPFHIEQGAPHPHLPQQSHFVLLADPFTFDAEAFLRGLDRTHPSSRKIGGLASGGQQPGTNALFLGRDVHRAGLVGVALDGDIEMDTIVAQGCRPIGQPMFITKCHDNVLWELDGVSAATVLQDLYEQLDPADQELARHSLFLGIVMSENQQAYRQGDFLIRNIIGMDATRGVLGVGAVLRENSVVQFHLRDAKTSAEDLEQLLARYEHGAMQPRGALLFSCLGRGVHLYGQPDHDTDAFRRHLGDVPLGGFFCNGEIGPVHGTTFLHGYTSSFGIFRRRSD